jgi:hypothetical protein
MSALVEVVPARRYPAAALLPPAFLLTQASVGLPPPNQSSAAAIVTG